MEEWEHEFNYLNSQINDLKVRIEELENKECGVCQNKLEGNHAIICNKCISDFYDEKTKK